MNNFFNRDQTLISCLGNTNHIHWIFNLIYFLFIIWLEVALKKRDCK